MDKIYLTKEGYEEYLEEIEQIRNSLDNNNHLKTEAYQTAVGDGWHDNFEYEQASLTEKAIEHNLIQMINNKKNIIIVDEPKNINNNLININDIFEAELKYSDNDIERSKFKLIGGYRPNNNNDIQEITLNSPIGKAVYLQNINSNLNYIVNGKKVELRIISKVN
ncbi:MAG: hypothetical protein ACM3O4_03495 [Ignavibacteriales bacterium]